MTDNAAVSDIGNTFQGTLESFRLHSRLVMVFLFCFILCLPFPPLSVSMGFFPLLRTMLIMSHFCSSVILPVYA